jgi:hypothetical protein
MSAPSKRTTAQVWKALEATADEVELARIDALDDEALDRELRQAGIDPGEAADVGKGVLQSASPEANVPVAAASQPKGVDSGRQKPARPSGGRMPWVIWLAAAAIAVLVLAAFAERREIQAWFGRAPIDKDDDRSPREPSPRERAARIRDDAFASCGESRWAECERRLNDAQRLDPGGESDSRVQAARAAVVSGLNSDGGGGERKVR